MICFFQVPIVSDMYQGCIPKNCYLCETSVL